MNGKAQTEYLRRVMGEIRAMTDAEGADMQRRQAPRMPHSQDAMRACTRTHGRRTGGGTNITPEQLREIALRVADTMCAPYTSDLALTRYATFLYAEIQKLQAQDTKEAAK